MQCCTSVSGLFFLPLLELVLNVSLQWRKLVAKALFTPPAPHVPAWPVTRVVPLATFLQRKVIDWDEEGRIEAQIMLLVLHAGRMHIPTHDMHMHMIHRRMCMHADLDISKPVSPRRKHCLALLWRRRLS
jgi:hypothetical protein